MDDVFYRNLIEESPTGYAYHKIICDKDNVPCDYEFIEANASFERLTGLKRSEIIGQKISKIMPLILKDSFDWIKFYGDIAINGGSKEIDQFSEPLQQWYRVKVYSPQKYFFITFFSDISKEMIQISDVKMLVSISEKFLQRGGKEINYQKIADDLLNISEAEYAVFNLYEEDGIHYQTKALSGNSSLIKKAVKLIGVKIENQKWEHDSVRIKKIKNATITHFSSLLEFLGETFPKPLISSVARMLNIGETVFVKILNNDVMIGDFILIMPKGKKFKKDALIEIYSRQTGLAIAGRNTEKDLIESNDLMRYVIEHNRSSVAVHDRDLRYIYVSQRYLDEYKIKEKDIIGRHHYEVFPDLPQKWRDVHQKCLAGEVISKEDDIYVRSDGSSEWTRWECRPWRKTDGSIGGIIVYTEVITARKNMENALKVSEEKYRLLTEFASDVIWVFNLNKNKFSYVSPSIFNLRGLSVEEAMNESLEDSLVPESLLLVKNAIQKGLKEINKNPDDLSYYIIEIRQPCKNGSIIWVEAATKYRHNSDGEIEIVGVSRNIEERKKSEEQVLHLSYHDQLTGLYNRRFYEEELKRLDVKRNMPVSLIMADVNGLKLTNDAFGHKTGDILLKKIAAILKKECRADEIVARIGGDEFIFLLPKTNAKNANKLTERIKAAIADDKTENVVLSVSLGFAVKNDYSSDINEIFKEAEDNMYRNKISESSSMRSKTIDLIINSLYEKNNREMLHSKRVSEICESIASKMNFQKDEINQMRIAGLMHDIGKIGVSDNILNKVEILDSDEWQEIMRHSEIGYRILSSVNEFSKISDYILEHHEKWNGKGYPRRLKGEEISIQARIIAVADSYDAMTSSRAYRRALSGEEAVKELNANSGIQFDPDVLKVFIKDVLGKHV